MPITIDTYSIPEKGTVQLKIHRSFDIKVSAKEARRQVNRWLRDEVSHLISTDQPTLAVGERVVWRVPAWIGFPNIGRIGQVGTVDVDVYTGAMNNTPQCKTAIERRAEKLCAHLPPYQPKGEILAEYLATNIPPVPVLIVENEDEPLTTAIAKKKA